MFSTLTGDERRSQRAEEDRRGLELALVPEVIEHGDRLDAILDRVDEMLREPRREVSCSDRVDANRVARHLTARSRVSASRPPLRRPLIATFAPDSTTPSAISSPIPRPPPVTMATLPVRSKKSLTCMTLANGYHGPRPAVHP